MYNEIKLKEQLVMFDTYEIGKRILELRIRNGLTQSQLADKLYVSYQAVSNWERGNSLPDIGKLGILARELNCRIDDIIGNNKEKDLINSILSDDYALIDFDEFSLHDLINIMPFIEDKKIEVILKKLNPSTFNFISVVNIAPFISKELINYLLDNCQIEIINVCELLELAPFVDGNRLDDLIKTFNIDNIDDITLISGLAPFVCAESLNILLEKINKESVDNIMILETLAPFISQNRLYELALCVKKIDDISEIMYLAPFFSSEELSVLVKKHFG